MAVAAGPERHARGDGHLRLLQQPDRKRPGILVRNENARKHVIRTCRAHILDELTGIKTMLESGDYDPQDVTYAFEDEQLLAKVKAYTVRTQT